MIKYLVGFAVGFLLWVAILSLTPMPEYRVYDCGMAEWHPDIPLEVKKQCRELKHQQWKKENEGKVQTNLYEYRKDIRGTQFST
jgi:hypothetical protein